MVVKGRVIVDLFDARDYVVKVWVVVTINKTCWVEVGADLWVSPVNRDAAHEKSMKYFFRGVVDGTFVFKGDGEFIVLHKTQFFHPFVAVSIKRRPIIEYLSRAINPLIFHQLLAELNAFFGSAILENEIAKTGFWSVSPRLHFWAVISRAHFLKEGIHHEQGKLEIAGISLIERKRIITEVEIGSNVLSDTLNLEAIVFEVVIPKNREK